MSIKPKKIVIIGAGHVGSHVGYTLASQGICDEIVFIDTDQKKAIAQVKDIEDAIVYMPYHTNIKLGDYTDIDDAEIIVISAGLAVFIFTGVIKGIPQELEESAMIDGASVPRIFFQITLPIMRPSVISVAILQAMWIWNDFLLPYLTLDMRRFKTMSIAIQYLKGGYGSVDMGAMMGCLVLAIIPIIIFYLVCQKYIIKGVMAGAVKG